MKTKSLRLEHALRVKAAEFWLAIGQPQVALLELRRLPKRALAHPWTGHVFQCALAACSAYYSSPFQTAPGAATR